MDNSQTFAQPENDTEGYGLDVNDVAQLLGVTRTRVSQLTTAGILRAERKKVGTRNRLFYKRSDVLNYQHQFFNRQLKAHPFDRPSPSTPSMWRTADRAGASIQSSEENLLSHGTLRQFQLSTAELDDTTVGQNLRSAISMIRKRLNKMANQPLVTAEWRSKESMIFESIDNLFNSLRLLDARYYQHQDLQQKGLDEIASIKKDLSHLHHLVLAQSKKPNLLAAQQTPTPNNSDKFSRQSPRRATLKTAGFRSTVKKRFTTR